MKNSLRRLATSFVVGSSGRVVAFVADVSVMTARYWAARLQGKKSW